MTEENKENCNFQQNYNVFGLDDKPCCYLYHKYCDEIDSCYFKRSKRLEQENKELKEKVKSLESEIRQKKMTIMMNNDHYLTVDKNNRNYRSALEEIKAILNKGCGIVSNAKAVGIINEVLECE